MSVCVPVSYAIEPFVGEMRGSLTEYDAGSLMQNAGMGLPVRPGGHLGAGAAALAAAPAEALALVTVTGALADGAAGALADG